MPKVKAKDVEPQLRFELDGTVYELNELEDFTFGEAEELEDFMGGVPFSDISWTSMKAIVFIAFLLKRRKNPNATFAEFRDLKINQFKQVEKRPTKAPSETSGDPSSSSDSD